MKLLLTLRINDEEFTVRVTVTDEDKSTISEAAVMASVVSKAIEVGFIMDPVACKVLPWHAVNIIEFVSLKEQNDE